MDPDRIVYDGECGLCRRSIGFYTDRAGHGSLPSCPSAQADLTPEQASLAEESLLVIRGDRTHARSAAVVRLLWRMRGAWPLLGTALWLVPRPLRDAGYDWVARRRHRLGGAR